jgi:indole-3-glycerol phosphate synthase
MNILDVIVEHKRVEVMKRKQKRPISNLNTSGSYGRHTNTMDTGMLNLKPGIIAEFKRKSPSKGTIHPDADPVAVAGGYAESGVSAVSILTDRDFFGGSFQDLLRVRLAYPNLVLLRKDFIIDPYQLHEASAYGADMVLLIAAILEKNEVSDLAQEAATLGLQVLFEVHDEKDLEKYHPGIGYVGVNNRDLKSFNVDMERSRRMIREMPGGVIPVSESGLGNPGKIKELHASGYRLFLIGETFMSHPDPGEACKEFIKNL